MSTSSAQRPRPLPSRAQAVSFSSATNSVPAVALAYLLRNIRPEDLHSRLLQSVDGNIILHPGWAIENVFNSLKAIGFVTGVAEAAAMDTNQRHCVRCHESYFERENGLKACVIHHDKGILVDRAGKSGKLGHYYPCCKRSLATNEALPSEFCVVDRHTTLKGNVNYNTTNMQDCEARQCHAYCYSTSVAPVPAPEKSVPSKPTVN